MLDFRRFADKMLDVLYPPEVSCYGCGDELTEKSTHGLCSCCVSELVGVPEKCVLYENLKVYSAFVYGGRARDIILNAKDGGRPYLSRVIGGFIADLYVSSEEKCEIIAYVPSSGRNKLRRGYDNMKNVARFVSQKTGLPVYDGLTRFADGADQTEIPFEKRRENVKGVFLCSGSGLEGKNVMLIDDVVTSGATLGACASALYSANPKNITGFTFCRAAETVLK
jgi:ComF family protein